MLELAGKRTLKFINDAGKFGRFSTSTVSSSLRCLFEPKSYSLIWEQMHIIGVQSLPVIMVTGAFVGMILAVQAYNQLAVLGFEERLGVLINVSVVKELGPVLSAVMLAGRVGGALTAELGTMNVTEQISAVRSMGTDPLKHLVVPRVMACLLLTPFLIIYADLLGIIGGFLVSVFHFEINSEAYWTYSANGIEMWDIMTGIVKGFFFGGAIAAISCFKGFTCKEGAQGVGQACTEAFVGSFMSILALDFMIGMIEKAIYTTFWIVPSIV